jgi:2-dehydro-3-deoxygalactonokinase
MNKFLSCDWGTSSFRIRLVDADTEEISGEVISDEGISDTFQQWMAAGLPEEERITYYKTILKRNLSRLPGTIDKNIPLLCSGMISSSIGLIELPYREFPFTWEVSQILVKKIDSSKEFPNPLYVISGFRTDTDIMRGEEMLLLGCDIRDDDKKIFIFPGTHSKHVFIKNKMAVDFKSYMTGEIFSLLSEKSILRNAVRMGSDKKSFTEGIETGLQGNILHHVFKVRTRQLLHQSGPVSNYQFLSGLLIGAELSDLNGINSPIYLVAGNQLEEPYRLGLSLTGVNREINLLSGNEMLIRGHCKLANNIFNKKFI